MIFINFYNARAHRVENALYALFAYYLDIDVQFNYAVLLTNCIYCVILYADMGE